MRRRATIHVVVQAFTVLGCVWFSGCIGGSPTVVQLPPPEVTVSKPVSRMTTDYFEFTGNSAAVQQVEVRSRVSGYIVSVAFQDGQEVKANALLIQIDPQPYQAALDNAKAEVARQQAMVQLGQADMARAEKLLPTGAITREEYDRTVAQHDVSAASLQAAKAAEENAQLDLGYTKIVSPIDGRASNVRFTVGNLVQAGAPGDTGILTTIESVNPMYVYFDVDERTLLVLKKAAREANLPPNGNVKDLKIPVQIGLADEGAEFPHMGILDFVDNKVDRQTGTIRARGVFDNAKRYLAPGLFVRVRMQFGDPRPVLLVTERAIGNDQGIKYVWVVDGQKRVHRREVELGRLQGRLRVIEKGLKPDDLVIVNGILRVREEIEVKPFEEAMPDAQAPAASRAAPAAPAPPSLPSPQPARPASPPPAAR